MGIVFDYLWFFVIYSILGWLLEVSFHVVKFGDFVNRGFLNGPACPIYGFGILGVILTLRPLENNVFLLFLGGVLFTSSLELFTGYVLERVFNKKWWNYKAMPYNFKGYICLRYSIYWGLGIILVMRVIHPYLEIFVSFLNNPFGGLVLTMVLGLFTTDFIVTIGGIMEIKRDMHTLEEIAKKLNEYSEEFGENIFKGISQAMLARENVKDLWDEKKNDLQEKINESRKKTGDLIDKYESILSKRTFVQIRLEKAFPNIKEIIKRKG